MKNERSRLHDELRKLLRPGKFIGYRASGKFVLQLEAFAGRLQELAKRDAETAIELFAELVDSCEEKAAELDDSDGGLGALAVQAALGWTRARELAGADDAATVKGLVQWMDDDPFGFFHDLESYLTSALSAAGLSELGRLARERVAGAAPDHGSIIGYPGRRWEYVLRCVYEAQGDIERFVEICGPRLRPDDYCVLADMCVRGSSPEQALEWIERGLELATGSGASGETFHLQQRRRRLLQALGRLDEAIAHCWAEFEADPSAFDYEQLMKVVPEADREKWSAKALACAERANLGSAVHLFVEVGRADLVADRLDEVADSDLEQASVFHLEPAAELLAPSHPKHAARLYRWLAVQILDEKDSRYYRRALRHLQAARDCFVVCADEELWNELVQALRHKHRRKSSFMPGLERVAAGGSWRKPSRAKRTSRTPRAATTEATATTPAEPALRGAPSTVESAEAASRSEEQPAAPKLRLVRPLAGSSDASKVSGEPPEREAAKPSDHTTNPYCDAVSISRPRLEDVKDHREASTYMLLIVALLERGAGMTLEQVAERFDEAGVAPADEALRSLKRCRPARAPVHRADDRYELDAHDDDLSLRVFMLGLRPPKKAPPLRLVTPASEVKSAPSVDQPLSMAELEEAWRAVRLSTAWSAKRIALAVLEAHGGEPMRPEKVVSFARELTEWQCLKVDEPHFGRRGTEIRVHSDGRWQSDASHNTMQAVRRAVREQLATARLIAGQSRDGAAIKRIREELERESRARAAELAKLSRVIVHVFPPKAPTAVVALDVGRRSIETWIGPDAVDDARGYIDGFDIIAAVDVRHLLRTLGIEPDGRRVAELGPPQKSKRINRSGRTLTINLGMLVQGSCGIARPFGDPKKLKGYLESGHTSRLRKRLESDVKSLFAIYQYGRLHGGLRLRWGFFDEPIPSPWASRDEASLSRLKRDAWDQQREVEIVAGNAPGWSDPWARAKRCRVVEGDEPYPRLWLRRVDGEWLDERDVQLARLSSRG